jgi:hypothetical protein
MEDHLVYVGAMVQRSQKDLLSKWARADKRSVSSFLRILIDQEAKRRRKQQEKQQAAHPEDA